MGDEGSDEVRMTAFSSLKITRSGLPIILTFDLRQSQLLRCPSKLEPNLTLTLIPSPLATDREANLNLNLIKHNHI
jgi:hypothetical protein